MLKSGVIMKCFHFLHNSIPNMDIIFVGKMCSVIKAFTEYPENSSLLNIFEIELSHGDSPLCEFIFSDIFCKGVVLPLDEKYVFSPLLHCE